MSNFLEKYEQKLTPKNKIKHQINVLKNKLQQTDYHAIKYAEGQLTEEEYSSIKLQRQEWRNEINRLEAEIEKLV